MMPTLHVRLCMHVKLCRVGGQHACEDAATRAQIVVEQYMRGYMRGYTNCPNLSLENSSTSLVPPRCICCFGAHARAPITWLHCRVVTRACTHVAAQDPAHAHTH